jgi:diacylglycerol kinase (ATP)
MLKTFKNALAGIQYCLKTQRNFRIHLFCASVVLILMVILAPSPYEKIFLVMTIGLVLTAEMFNTAVELICDIISAEYSLKIKTIKDISAGGVLITAGVAVVVGFLVFASILNYEF